jgi:hypothetical protein
LHQSPFGDLVVPVSITPLDALLRDRWVKPLYMAVPHDLGTVVPLVRSKFDEINADLIRALLAELNWRPRIVGGFLVALDPRADFEELVGKLLLRSDVCYAGESYCLALGRLNTPRALGFLQTYLRYYLRRADLYFDQAAALAAVRYLDQVNGTSHSGEFDRLWSDFIRDKPHWDLDGTYARFNAAMRCIGDLRASCSPSPS